MPSSFVFQDLFVRLFVDRRFQVLKAVHFLSAAVETDVGTIGLHVTIGSTPPNSRQADAIVRHLSDARKGQVTFCSQEE